MSPSPQSSVKVPPELRAKFADLIDLILASESMNDEERQYWINILPIMTPEQIQNLNGILENERKQLAAIDQKYATQIEQIGQNELIHKTEELRKKKQSERKQKEMAAEAKEEQDTSTLLKEIENL